MGGSGLKETILWENQSPTSNFNKQDVVLSSGVSNFDAVRFYFKVLTTSTTIQSCDISVETLVNCVSGPQKPIIALGRTGNSIITAIYARGITYINNTSLNIGDCNYGGDQSNTSVIPIKISGLKY